MKRYIVTAALAAIILASTSVYAKTGEEVYNSVCKMCHASGMMGAPKMGNKADWGPRISQGKNVLVDHALHGYKKMPAKGTCRSCSDEDIANAVQFFMDKAK